MWDELMRIIDKYPAGSDFIIEYDDGTELYAELDTIFETDNGLELDDPDYKEYIASTFMVKEVTNVMEYGHGLNTDDLFEVSTYSPITRLIDNNGLVIWERNS